MILSMQKTRRFLKLFLALVRYAADELGYDDMLDAEEPEPDDVIELCHRVWDDGGRLDLVDAFVRDNPFHLNRTDLREVAGWRQSLMGAFDVVRDGADVFYLMGGHAFAVRGIIEEADISDGIPVTRVECLLVPFDGMIAQGAYALDVSRVSDALSIRRALDELDACRAEGRVTRTARDFAGMAEAARAAGQVASAYDADGQGGHADLVPRPQHAGALAGLSWEERLQAIQDDLIDHLDDMLASLMREEIDRYCQVGAPTSSMRQILSRLGRGDLLRMAERFNASHTERASKARLVAAVLEAMPREAEDFLGQAILRGVEELDRVRRVFEAGGRIDVRSDDSDALKGIAISSWPAVVVFRTGDGYACVMPDLAREALEDADWDEFHAMAEELSLAVDYAGLMADMRGVVPLVDVARDCIQSLHIHQSPVTILLSLDKNRDITEAPFDIVEFGHESLLVCGFLRTVDAEPGTLAWHDQSTATEILSAHRRIEPRPIAQLMEGERGARPLSVKAYLEGQPSYRELNRYLDAHIPEGQNELHFTDEVIDELIDRCLTSRPDEVCVEALEGILALHGFVVGADDADAFGKMLSDLVSTVPNWYANGWPATRMR